MIGMLSIGASKLAVYLFQTLFRLGRIVPRKNQYMKVALESQEV